MLLPSTDAKGLTLGAKIVLPFFNMRIIVFAGKCVATFIVFFILYVISLRPGIIVGKVIGYIGPHFSLDAQGILGGFVAIPVGILGAAVYFRRSRDWPPTYDVAVIIGVFIASLVLKLMVQLR